jgi:hypothetical protein
MNALILLLVTALSMPISSLILRNGGRIDVDGGIRVEQGRVIFRSGGALYSIPEAEVDLAATRAVAAIPVVKAESKLRLKVSEEQRDRLLRDLEQNHSGTPTTAKLPPLPPFVSEREALGNPEEWSWRRDAQNYEESIRRAQENLDLLRTRSEQLRAHIAGLLSLGYHPRQFTYDSSQLQNTLEQIPYAEFEVQRAERAYAQFRENARRQGILPGWLR